MKSARFFLVAGLFLGALFIAWRWHGAPTHAPSASPEPPARLAENASPVPDTGPDKTVEAAAPETEAGPPVWRILPDKIAPDARGYPITAIDIAPALSLLPTLEKGSLVSIDLGEDGVLQGRVTLVVNDEYSLRVGGVSLANDQAFFWLAAKDGALTGFVELPAKGERGMAYTLATTSESRGQIKRQPLSNVRCVGIPKEPDDLNNIRPAQAAAPAIPRLESRPGAKDVFYLDFDGEEVTGTSWNSGFTDGGPIKVQPANLTAYEIEQIWKSVSEAYSPFNVNITTSLSVYTGTPADRRMRCIITPTDAWYIKKTNEKVGGMAWVDSFGVNKDPPDETCWVFNTNMKTVAMAIAHELGHTVGLAHHGGGANVDGEYNLGHGSRPLSWGPIMGAPYHATVVQWSRGEYEDANNSEQDDLAVIHAPLENSTKGGLAFINDGHGGTRQTAKAITKKTGPTTWSLNTPAVITDASDVNFHRFTVPTEQTYYTTSINAILTEFMPTLKIALELRDETGGFIVASDTAAPRMDTELNVTLNAGKTYYIKAWGAGYRDPRTDGFSAYGSVGQYNLSINLAAPFEGSPRLAEPLPPVTALAGQTVMLRASVLASPAATIKWQSSFDGGETWEDVSDGGSYSGVQTGTLVIRDVAAWMDGILYRFEASNPLGSIFSNAARLIIDATPLPHPTGLACDLAGNLYVTDDTLHTVQKIELSTGRISTLAGWPRLSGTTGAPGTSARFDSPAALSHDRVTNSLYVADAGNNVIRKIALDGSAAVSVFSGTIHQTPTVEISGTDGTVALYDRPAGIATLPNGYTCISDEAAQLIWTITSSGSTYVTAGTLYKTGTTDGLCSEGQLFYMPSGIALDDVYNIFIADSGNHTIRVCMNATDRPLDTIAGAPEIPGWTDGTGDEARFNNPRGVCVLGEYLYVADTGNSTIRRIHMASTEVRTIAGVAGITGAMNGTGTTALFSHPEAVTMSPDGYLLVADSGNGLIRKINLKDNGRFEVSTLALVSSGTVYPPYGGGGTGGGGGSGIGTGGNTGTQSTSSGGGAPSPWFLLAFAALAGLRSPRPRR
ncbi:MAG: hypothetical protein LBI02_02690 [Opitutaceae bacterium]|jgi:hypothetical protein|nr:hypothetical protein [Opitutaceae bacterium]